MAARFVASLVATPVLGVESMSPSTLADVVSMTTMTPNPDMSVNSDSENEVPSRYGIPCKQQLEVRVAAQNLAVGILCLTCTCQT